MSLLINTFEMTSFGNHHTHFAIGVSQVFGGVRDFSHRQLQQFVEQSVVFALKEGVGAAGLGYSYPGESGFLGVGRRRGHSIRQGGREVTEGDKCLI